MAIPTKEEIAVATKLAREMTHKLQELYPEPNLIANAIMGAAMINVALNLQDFDLFYWMKMIVDPRKPPEVLYQTNTERAMAIIRAGVEAQVMNSQNMTIVLVADKDGELDIASTAPSEKIASRAADVMFMASLAMRGSTRMLDRIEIGQS